MAVVLHTHEQDKTIESDLSEGDLCKRDWCKRGFEEDSLSAGVLAEDFCQKSPRQKGCSPSVMSAITLTLVGLSSFLAVGCSPSNLVAQGIERELPQYVGPADSYDVDIKGLKVKAGSAESVVAVGDRVRPEGAPVIERLALELQDVIYDRQSERVSQVGNARLTAVIRTNDLATFLEAYRNVREAQITLRSPNEATIRLRPQLGNFAVPRGVTVDVSGQIVGSGTQLRFDVDAVSAAGFDLSTMAASRLSDVINPLADLQNLPVEVNITSVVVAGETIGLEVVGDPQSFEL